MNVTPPGAPPGPPPGNPPGPNAGGRRRRWGRPRQPAGAAPAPAARRFSGQQQGEQVVFLTHKHWWFLLKPGWLPLLLLLALAGTITLHLLTPAIYGPLWVLLEVLLGLLLLIFLLRWAYSDVANWWFTVYILTNKRLVLSQGFLQPTRKEAPLDKIQQVYQEARNLWEYLLNYGNVTILTAAGPIVFAGVANPRILVERLQDAQRDYQATRKTPEAAAVKDESMRRVIDQLAAPTLIPPPPSPDPPPRPGAFHGPVRTFGGPLRLSCKVRYFPDERTIQYIQRHPYIFVRNAAPGALLAVLLVVVTFLLHFLLWPVFVGGILAGLAWVGYSYINYVDDVYILTTHRIIDIDRAAIIFFEGRSIVEYGKVQDVIVEVSSVIARSLDFGLVRVQTAGAQQKVRMRDVPNPFAIQDAIFQRINAGKEREAVQAANKQKAELKRWFAELANTMHDLRTPDLLGKPFEEAAHLLGQHHITLRVMGEQRMTGLPPGHVVQQNPPPGTILSHDGQVYVILSRI
jgi:membrane protein YdbS with pleckstrin-like domain